MMAVRLRAAALTRAALEVMLVERRDDEYLYQVTVIAFLNPLSKPPGARFGQLPESTHRHDALAQV